MSDHITIDLEVSDEDNKTCTDQTIRGAGTTGDGVSRGLSCAADALDGNLCDQDRRILVEPAQFSLCPRAVEGKAVHILTGSDEGCTIRFGTRAPYADTR